MQHSQRILLGSSTALPFRTPHTFLHFWLEVLGVLLIIWSCSIQNHFMQLNWFYLIKSFAGSCKSDGPSHVLIQTARTGWSAECSLTVWFLHTAGRRLQVQARQHRSHMHRLRGRDQRRRRGPAGGRGHGWTCFSRHRRRTFLLPDVWVRWGNCSLDCIHDKTVS